MMIFAGFLFAIFTDIEALDTARRYRAFVAAGNAPTTSGEAGLPAAVPRADKVASCCREVGSGNGIFTMVLALPWISCPCLAGRMASTHSSHPAKLFSLPVRMACFVVGTRSTFVCCLGHSCRACVRWLAAKALWPWVKASKMRTRSTKLATISPNRSVDRRQVGSQAAVAIAVSETDC